MLFHLVSIWPHKIFIKAGMIFQQLWGCPDPCLLIAHPLANTKERPYCQCLCFRSSNKTYLTNLVGNIAHQQPVKSDLSINIPRVVHDYIFSSFPCCNREISHLLFTVLKFHHCFQYFVLPNFMPNIIASFFMVEDEISFRFSMSNFPSLASIILLLNLSWSQKNEIISMSALHFQWPWGRSLLCIPYSHITNLEM